MTVRLAQDMGMPLIVEYARRFGVYDDLMPVLAMSLGAGETTLLRMCAAYAVLDNGGKQVQPTLIDRIQDRWGRSIWRHDKRECKDCKVEKWQSGETEPDLTDDRRQIIDPHTAYQMTSMMQGVVLRGTGTIVKRIIPNLEVAGKTGTTNEEKDAWFIGYTPDLVVGVFVGYDTPQRLERQTRLALGLQGPVELAGGKGEAADPLQRAVARQQEVLGHLLGDGRGTLGAPVRPVQDVADELVAGAADAREIQPAVLVETLVFGRQVGRDDAPWDHVDWYEDAPLAGVLGHQAAVVGVDARHDRGLVLGEALIVGQIARGLPHEEANDARGRYEHDHARGKAKPQEAQQPAAPPPSSGRTRRG